MTRDMLSQVIYLMVFFIQFAFILVVFLCVFAGFVDQFDPKSELLDLTLSIALKAGLVGVILLILTFGLVLFSSYLNRQIDNPEHN